MHRKKLNLIFYPGILPTEYARAERISTYFGLTGLFIFGVLLFPSHRYLQFAGASLLAFWLGRLVGVSWQDQQTDETMEARLGMIQKLGIALFVALVAAALVTELYLTWTTGAPAFAMQSILGVAVLTYPLSKGKAKIILGAVDAALVIVSLVFYLLVDQAGFLAVGAFAAFVAWALLFKKEGRESSPDFRSPGSDGT